VSRDKTRPRSGATIQEFSVITNPDAASLKRVAWLYGCAKKDSAEERQLRDILITKAKLG
jgi:hypothetical protein